MALTRIRADQITGLDYKQAVRAISLSNVNLNGGAPAMIDGVSLVANNRILVAGQDNGSQNGLYYVSVVGAGSNGTWLRTTDGDQEGEIEAGMIVMVTEGDVYNDTLWKLITNDPIIIGVTPLVFVLNTPFAFGNINANGTAILATEQNDTLNLVGGDNMFIEANANTRTITFTSERDEPAGNLFEIQFNDYGLFGGSSNFVWSETEIFVGANANITGNVLGNYFIGNASQLTGVIANATYADTANVANFANSVDGANVTGEVANAAYATTANVANYADSVAGANVVGEVANAAYANTANLANYAYSVDGANVVGEVANAAYANAAGLADYVTQSNQSNITLVGNLVNLTVSGDTVVMGNLQVDGNVTYISSNVVTINDKFINVANNAVNASQANGGGIGVGPVGSEYATWSFNDSETAWTSNIEVQAPSFSATGNVTGDYIIGNGSALTSLTGANVTGEVANAAYATTANLANFATEAFNVAGANVTGEVANAAYANTANVANYAYSVDGANVSGEVANAAYANTANLANFATEAFSINGANVSGEVANAAYANVANVANFANSVDGANVTGEVANAAYANTANIANYAYSVDGANVTGEVANAAYANVANVANFANSVNGANVSGEVANAAYAVTANVANFANSVDGANVSGEVANAAYATTANLANFATEAFNVNGANVSGEVANAAYANVANLSNFATEAFNVNGANVTGEVANAAYANTANIANYAYSVDGANVTGEVANAAYATTANLANFATEAFNVAGANVTGEVANAAYATTANLANFATEAFNVNGANVTGEVANAAYANTANLANFATEAFNVNGANVTGEVANAAYANTANIANYAYSVDGANVTGEVANAAYANAAGLADYVTQSNQSNITAVGNLVGLTVAGDATITGNLQTDGNITSSTRVITPEVTTLSGDLVLNSAGGALQWDGAGNIVMNSQWINNLSGPVQAQDAATKEYVDNAVSTGITIHDPVYVESPTSLPAATYAQGGTTATVTDTLAGNTVVFSSAINPQPNDQLWFATSFQGIVANVAYFVVSAPNTSAAVLSTTYNGTAVSNITTATGLTESVRINSGQGATLTANTPGQLTIDGVNPSANARVLIYNQTPAYENGVYVVTDTGNVSAPWILTRSSDTNTYKPNDITGLDAGDYFYVQAGDTGAGESYVMTAPIGPFIIGYNSLTFTQFSASQVYTANTAAGLVLNGTIFSAKVDNNTTAFDGNGNIVVKVGANLTTPNIGAATGISLSVAGNVEGSYIIGNGSALTSLTGANVTGEVTNAAYATTANVANYADSVAGANVTGEVANAAYATTANLANFATEAFNVAGANVTGEVANAAYANVANVANFANSVDGANVTGEVANAAYANVANVANYADSVAGANVVGEVANAAYANTSNIANYAYSVDGANVVGEVANAAYANTSNIANYAYSVDGANVSGEVANAAYANTANLANFATEAFNVDGANVSGEVANAAYANTANVANYAYSVDGANVVGEVANAAYANTANVANYAYSVDGANVSGEVANAAYANTANLANFATEAFNVAGANVTGEVANAAYANVANVSNFATEAFNVNGANVTGEVANAAYANLANVANYAYSVDGANVSGEVANAAYANAAGLADYVTQSSQGNITELGNLVNLTVAGNALIMGNLQVDGNVTYISSNVVTINDKFINLANNAANSSEANGGGIGIGPVGSEYATWVFDDSQTAWVSNIEIQAPSFSATGNVTGGNLTTSGQIIGGSANVTGLDVASGGTGGSIKVKSGAGLTTIELDGSGFIIANGNVDAANFNTAGNVTGSYIIGNGSLLTNIAGANVTGEVANAAYANTANLANFATEAFNVNGANVSGEVANAAYANTANLANFAYSVDGANVVGEVANAAYANTANLANFATEAFNVNGANVTGEVANAAYANTANYATFADTVIASSQPNITSVGNLTNLTVDGNIGVGNITAIGNIAGAYFIGNGSQLTGISTSTSQIFNGDSNVDIATANANVTVSVNGVSNVVVIGTDDITIDGPNVNVTAGDITGLVLKSNQSAGDDGGEIQLALPAANTTLVGGIAIDSYQNKVRIFETGGTNRGGYFDIANLAAGVGTDLAAGGGGTPTSIVNGTSNVVVAPNGNVTVGIAGNGVATFSAGVLEVLGNLMVTNEIEAANLKVNDQILAIGNIEGDNIIANNIVYALEVDLTGGTLEMTGGDINNANVISGSASADLTIVANQGNIRLNTANSVTSNANVVVTGNITGGNLITSGQIIGGSANVTSLDAFSGGTGGSIKVKSGAGQTTIELDGSGFIIANGNVDAANFNTTGNVTGSYIIGNGSLLTDITAANVTGEVANAAYAVTANVANFANSVDGANVTGEVANAAYANTANVANFANSVDGANVTGEVANAAYANTANLANFATEAFNVAGANVTGEVANAAYANVANVANFANSVDGANVVGSVANAAYADLANAATFAGTVTEAAQPNITSVGTLTSLTVSGNITGGNISTVGTSTANVVQANIVSIDTSVTRSGSPGDIAWDAEEATFNMFLENGVILQAGQEQNFWVIANGNINNGAVVAFDGAVNNSIVGTTANAAAPGFQPEYVIGLATQFIEDGVPGYVTTFGKVRDINTNAFEVGDIVYFDPTTPGGLVVTEPLAPNPKIQIGAVLQKGIANGSILVRPTVFPSLESLQDVSAVAPDEGDYLRFTTTGNLWQHSLLNIADDTTPTLGGNLEGNNYNVSNVNTYSGSNLILTGAAFASASVTQPSQLATKAYVDTAVSTGLHVHQAVRTGSSGNLNVVYTTGGTTQTVDEILNNKTVKFTANAALSVNDEIVFGNSFNGIVGNTAYFIYSTNGNDEVTLSDTYDGVEIIDLVDGGPGLNEPSRTNAGVGATLTNAGANAAINIANVALNLSDRVLIYGQTDATQNGPYVVTTVGDGSTAWVLTRSSDGDTYSPQNTNSLGGGDYFYVSEGDNGGQSFVCSNEGVIIFGSTAIMFDLFSAAPTYTGVSPVVVSGLNISLANLTGIGDVVVLQNTPTLITPNIGAATGLSVNITGNVTGGNLVTAGQITATGNVSGGNITTSGNVSAVGYTGATISVSGNVATGNLDGAGYINAVANVSGGNLVTTGVVTAVGNITGNYFFGNGSQLSGIDATSIQNGTSNVRIASSGGNITAGVGGTSNILVLSTAGANITGTLGVTGAGGISASNVTIQDQGQLRFNDLDNSNYVAFRSNATVATNVVWTLPAADGMANQVLTTQGDGNLTWTTPGGGGLTWTTQANTAPVGSSPGDFWYDSYNQIKYQYIDDGTSNAWVDQSAPTTFASISVGQILNTNSAGVGNIGSIGTPFNTVFAKATSAQYADLAEQYLADHDYVPGTVVVFGGSQEITQSSKSHDPRVAGVVSTQPAFIMNDGAQGLPVALTGRVPCRVKGPVARGDVLVTSDIPGVAQRLETWSPGVVIGKSMTDVDDDSITVIEIAIGRF